MSRIVKVPPERFVMRCDAYESMTTASATTFSASTATSTYDHQFPVNLLAQSRFKFVIGKVVIATSSKSSETIMPLVL